MPRKKAEIKKRALKRDGGSASIARTKSGKRLGRPPRVFSKADLLIVERLAGELGTMQEIADRLGVKKNTVIDHCSTDPDFCKAFAKGRSKAIGSLRRSQYKAATRGNVTMQIWLGKNVLGQRDVRALEVTKQKSDTDRLLDEAAAELVAQAEGAKS